MKISCLNCNRADFQFELLGGEIENICVIAITCPNCGKSTAIQQRPGGGIEIALDKHLENNRGNFSGLTSSGLHDGGGALERA